MTIDLCDAAAILSKEIYAPFLNAVVPLLWDTSIQGTLPFRGHKISSLKNVHIIFIFFTSVEGRSIQEKGTHTQKKLSIGLVFTCHNNCDSFQI